IESVAMYFYDSQQKIRTLTNLINIMSFNNNSKSLQNPTPTCNTSSFSDMNFLNATKSNEANTEGSEGSDEQSIKRCKNAHPLWAYFKGSSDDKWIHCKLCKPPNRTYRRGSSISTIKCHFETNHKAVYQKCRSDLQEVEPYGVHDDGKDKDFRAFIFELNPRYKLPTRQTISTYVGLLYQREREQLHSYFRKFNHKVSITTDAWSSCTNQAFLSVTLHWIDDQWQMQRILLDFIPLHERHTDDEKARASMCLKTWYDSEIAKSDLKYF
ncbi:15601_t:CDS:2, partial [Cetraspora pellucida]